MKCNGRTIFSRIWTNWRYKQRISISLQTFCVARSLSVSDSSSLVIVCMRPVSLTSCGGIRRSVCGLEIHRATSKALTLNFDAGGGAYTTGRCRYARSRRKRGHPSCGPSPLAGEKQAALLRGNLLHTAGGFVGHNHDSTLTIFALPVGTRQLRAVRVW
jgi:hypothetical protein